MNMDSFLDGAEIPFDMLKGVVGGTLTEAQMGTLDRMIAYYMNAGRSKKELMAMLAAADPEKGLPAEMIAYVDKHWG